MVTISADGIREAGIAIKSLSDNDAYNFGCLIVSLFYVLMYLAVVKFSFSVFYFFAD